MPTIDLGPVGAVLDPGSDRLVEAAVDVEALGYPTIWLTGGPLQGLDQVADVVQATYSARIGTAILAVHRFGVAEVNALYRRLEAAHPGRLVVGLGGARSAHPIQTLTDYLDALDAVPIGARVLSALGPRMLDLARRRTAGALPVFLTPEYTAQARAALGDGSSLIVMDFAALDTDPEQARAKARGVLGHFTTLPAYQAHFRRMGFTDGEITGLADRFVESVAACGDLAVVIERIRAHRQAGATHVAVNLLGPPAVVPVEGFRQLATALGL